MKYQSEFVLSESIHLNGFNRISTNICCCCPLSCVCRLYLLSEGAVCLQTIETIPSMPYQTDSNNCWLLKCVSVSIVGWCGCEDVYKWIGFITISIRETIKGSGENGGICLTSLI